MQIYEIQFEFIKELKHLFILYAFVIFPCVFYNGGGNVYRFHLLRKELVLDLKMVDILHGYVFELASKKFLKADPKTRKIWLATRTIYV